MARPRRHSRKTALSAPEDLAAGLPEHLRNPNGVGSGIRARGDVPSEGTGLSQSPTPEASGTAGADPRTPPVSLDEYRRAIADYLRTEGVSADLSAHLAPDV